MIRITLVLNNASVFSSGDAKDWFQRFEICFATNRWKVEDQAIKLPTLLEGEVLAIWLELTEEWRKDYESAKKEIQNTIMLMGFVSLEEFHRQRLRPGKVISVFTHDLKKLLDMAIPGMNREARDPLLLHQFVSGLPKPIMKQLRASGEVKTLEAAITHSRKLMTIDSESVSAFFKEISKECMEMQELRDQVALLTEQVASLSTPQSDNRQQRRPPRCYICGQIGHVQHDCQTRLAQSCFCFSCGQPGHLTRNCWYQGNEQGTPAQSNRHPRQ